MSKVNALRKEVRASEGKARGPKPEVLKINGSWRNAVKKTFSRKKPANGWSK